MSEGYTELEKKFKNSIKITCVKLQVLIKFKKGVVYSADLALN